MKDETEAAARFITQLVSQNQPQNITDVQLKEFGNHLARLFRERYHDHWFPERPQRGQAFRCIRLNGRSQPDPLIQEAALVSGLDYRDLKLPVEFTMWVDPKEVSCRFGEHEGSYCTVASFENGGSGDQNGGNSNTMTPLQVTVTDDGIKTQGQQSPGSSSNGSSSSSNRGPRNHRNSITRSTTPLISPPTTAVRTLQQQQSYRIGCFYPNYEPQNWYAYSSLSPPLALTNYHHHYHHTNAAKSRSYGAGWGLTYVPTTVRYLTNSWPAMVKV